MVVSEEFILGKKDEGVDFSAWPLYNKKSATANKKNFQGYRRPK
jgi:hypothetical protein